MVKEIMLIKRACKLIGLRFSKNDREIFTKGNRVINTVLSDIRSRLKSGEFIRVHNGNYIHANIDSHWKEIGEEYEDKKGNRYISVTNAQYKNFLSDNDIIDWEGAIPKRETEKRDLVIHAMERFASWGKRNNKKNKKSKIANIHHKGKNYPVKGLSASIDKVNYILTIKTPWGDISTKFKKVPKNAAGTTNLEYITREKFGVNINHQQNIAVIAIEREVSLLYEPETFWSYDLNKTGEYWLVFNDGTIIPANDELVALFGEIRDVQVLNKDKDKPVIERQFRNKHKVIDGKVFPARNKTRKEWQSKHNQLKFKLKPIANDIVNKTMQKRAVLCIDAPSTGAGSGTFGQDHLTKLLVTKCEDYGIPFYVVPCAFTSQRCSKCGATNKASRTETNEYECIECGHKINSHLNAAKNIEHRAKVMFEAGVPYGDYKDTKDFNKLITKYSSQQSQVSGFLCERSGRSKSNLSTTKLS